MLSGLSTINLLVNIIFAYDQNFKIQPKIMVDGDQYLKNDDVLVRKTKIKKLPALYF